MSWVDCGGQSGPSQLLIISLFYLFTDILSRDSVFSTYSLLSRVLYLFSKTTPVQFDHDEHRVFLWLGVEYQLVRGLFYFSGWKHRPGDDLRVPFFLSYMIPLKPRKGWTSWNSIILSSLPCALLIITILSLSIYHQWLMTHPAIRFPFRRSARHELCGRWSNCAFDTLSCRESGSIHPVSTMVNSETLFPQSRP